MSRCAWHCGHVADVDAVLVGVIEQGSGPGIVLHACTRCVARYGITPLAEHPADSMGEPIAERMPSTLGERTGPVGIRRAP